MNPRAKMTAIALLALAAATPSAAASEDSRYLLIATQDGRVVLEIDTGNGGMASCPEQVAMMASKEASGVTYRCSGTPSGDPLPFSFVAHRRDRKARTAAPSGPFRVRAATAARCALVRDTTRDEKTLIVEDRCSRKG